MKKLLICLLAAIAMSFIATKASMAAAAPSKSLDTGVNVINAAPEINILVYKFTTTPLQDLSNGQKDSTGTMKLNFGDLVHTYRDDAGNTQDAGVWYSTTSYLVQIFAQGFGKKYEIKSSSSGIGTLPGSAFVLTPVYSTADYYVFPDNSQSPAQGSRPDGSVLGSASSAANTAGVSIYKSESGGIARILQAWYSIPPAKIKDPITQQLKDPYTGWVGIPLSTTTGTYTGSVTISIAAI